MQISARLSNFWDDVKAISFGCCEYNELARLNRETYKSSGNVTPKIAVRLVSFRFPERAMPFRSLYYLAPAPKLLRRIADTFHALQICLDYPNVSIDASQINDSFIHNFENFYSFQTEICISSVCNFCKLLRIIEIIFNNTTAIILQAENLLTKVYGSKRFVCWEFARLCSEIYEIENKWNWWMRLPWETRLSSSD